MSIVVAGSTPFIINSNIMPDLTSLKEIGIGISALFFVALIVKYFLAAQKSQREDFCVLMSNHIDHNTKAIENLDGNIEKNTLVLSRLADKLEK